MRDSNPVGEKLIKIQIDKDEVFFTPETKRAVDLEILLLHIPLLASVGLLGFNVISWPLFFLIFYPVAMRIFIGNHDRYHADQSVKLPGLLEKFTEGLAVVVTPWDEPYDSIRKKHLVHHDTHDHGTSAEFDTKNDPHSVYEDGGFFRILLSCLFYEEIQLFLDIKHGKLRRSRLSRFLVYTPIIALFIVAFGWTAFLGVFLAMRIVGFTAWFVFSWVIHQPLVYNYGFSKKVPKWFKLLFLVLHGRRVTEGCLHHATHHTWPLIPPDQLHKFDEACKNNPDFNREVQPILVEGAAS